jgi:hypothetical protein
MKFTTFGCLMLARMAISRSKNCLNAAWLPPCLLPADGLLLPQPLALLPVLQSCSPGMGALSMSNARSRFTATCTHRGSTMLESVNIYCRTVWHPSSSFMVKCAKPVTKEQQDS